MLVLRRIRFRLLAVLLAALAVTAHTAPAAGAADELEQSFLNPPEEARPWDYWFWMNGNITREGITADLEAMKRAGICGALIMHVSAGIPAGPVRILTKHSVTLP